MAKEEAESRVYDIIQDDIGKRKESAITLNGAELIRTQLNISEKG